MTKRIILLALLVLVSLMGCRERIEPEADDFVEYGWILYAERDFRGAYDEFTEALVLDSVYVDAHNGSGWCYTEFNNPDSARYHFEIGLALIIVDSVNVRFEMTAGLALTYHALEAYEEAIEQVGILYAERPLFEFSHDWRINYVDLIVVAASSNVALGNFSQAYTWVRRYDGSFVTNVSTLEGRADLIKKIEAIQNL